jgi:transcriptional regulator with XRE-family HTH domain
MTACESFGAALRQERERRGLTLAAVSDRTKISPHLLRSLEGGDVSRWPGGIYRRGFIRAYAATVGLPPEPTLEEFLGLFPEPGQNPRPLGDDESGGLRLTLVDEPHWRAPFLRSAAAFVDAGAVLCAAYVVSTLADSGFWTSAGLVGLAWHAIAAISIGGSPGAWLVAPRIGLRNPEPIWDRFGFSRLPGLRVGY